MPVYPSPSPAPPGPFQPYNTTPLADFCELNPAQMHQLLFHPLEPACVVRLRAGVPDEVLDQVPFLRLTEAFLRLLHREGGIRLTPLGALPLKYLRELYALGFIREPGIELGIHKLSREIDSLALTTLHQTTRLAGLARLARGQLLLPKKGGQLLAASQRPALWRLVLQTFTARFPWATHDGYPSPKVGQVGWAYSVYCWPVLVQRPIRSAFILGTTTVHFPLRWSILPRPLTPRPPSGWLAATKYARLSGG